MDDRLQHHQLDLRNREDVLGQRAPQARQVDLRCRVMQDVILPRHPFEPHAQRHQPRVLAAERQRFAVLFAVEEQVPLIAFEHRARHLDGFPQAMLVSPPDEEADVNQTVLHRVLGVATHPQRVQVRLHERFERRLRRGLGLALPGDARHHFTAARFASPCPFGFSAPLALGTTTICFWPESDPLSLNMFSENRAVAVWPRVIAGDTSLSSPPARFPRTPRDPAWLRLLSSSSERNWYTNVCPGPP